MTRPQGVREKQAGCQEGTSRAEQALDYFREGLYCSEAIVRAFAENSDLALGTEVRRTATVFGAGLGGAKCVCGSLVGGAIVLGAAFGRTSPDESEQPAFDAVRLLHDRFKRLHGATCCRRLTRPVEWGTPEHHIYCEQFVVSAVQLTEEILAECASQSPNTLEELRERGERKEERA